MTTIRISIRQELARTLLFHGSTLLVGGAVMLAGLIVIQADDRSLIRLAIELALWTLGNLIFLSGIRLHDASERLFGRRCAFLAREQKPGRARTAQERRRRRAWSIVGAILVGLFTLAVIWDEFDHGRPFHL